MPVDTIEKHFTAYLGADVGVTVAARRDLAAEVILYRPDRLAEDFVVLAYQALEDEKPDVARRIAKLLVAYDSPLGHTRCRVDIRPGQL